MKKTIIISGLVLLTLSAFAQRPTRERTQQETRKHKSETTVKRSTPARDQQPASRTRTSASRENIKVNRTRTGTGTGTSAINRTHSKRPENTVRRTETRTRNPIDRTGKPDYTARKTETNMRNPVNRTGENRTSVNPNSTIRIALTSRPIAKA